MLLGEYFGCNRAATTQMRFDTGKRLPVGWRLMNVNMIGRGRIFFSGIFLLSSLCSASAQSVSLSIDEMFRLADQNSKSIRMHELAISEAEQGVKVAKDGRLPSIGFGLELQYIGDGWLSDRDFSNGVHADMPHFGNSYVIKAAQVVYAGGSVSRNIESSRLSQQMTEQEYANNRQNVRFLLLGHYLDLFQLNNQKVVYEKNIEQTRLLVKDMQASYRQGTALKSDITRYELQLQNLELALTSVKDKIDILSYRLATTIGLDPGVQIVPDSMELRKLTVEDLSEASWMQQLEESPSIRLADLKIAQEENREQKLRAERRPQVQVFATNDFTGPILIEVPPLNKNFTNWYAGVGISYNIDALFRTGKKLRQARFATQKMEEARNLALEEAENSVHAAYVNLNEAYIRLRTQRKSVQLAHENFNIVRQRYVNGLALITDMLDASNTQLDMELQLANYQIGIIYQYYLLKKITGTI